MSRTSPHPSPPPGYRVRAASPGDAEAVARLKSAVESERHGESDVTADYVREEWALPRLDLAHDAWVVEHETGAVAGYGLCWMEAPPDGLAAEQTVHPRHRGRGLSALLLGLCEERAAELTRAAGHGAGATLTVTAHEHDVPRLDLLRRRGYRRERTFFRLERDLDGSLEPPVWPPGIRPAAFRPGVDDAAVHAAHDEGFADHDGLGATDLEEWLESRLACGDPDSGLWLLAWDGDEVVGGVEAVETPSGALVGELFVRPPWRGRGIGRALMLQECADLRRRGLRNAFFAVDAANATGALELHASIGFRSTRGATLLYEKRLDAP
jgi:mycothiol synthase